MSCFARARLVSAGLLFALMPALFAESVVILNVTDASGAVITAYTLSAFHVSGDAPPTAKRDVNGLIGVQKAVRGAADRPEGLFPGKWALSASVRGKYASAWQVVDLREGENRLALELAKPETLWIELKDFPGRDNFPNAILIHDQCPLAEHVRQRWVEGKWSRQAPQPPGVFAAPLSWQQAYPTEDLPAGRYTLLASSANALIWTAGIEVKAGGENRVTVRPAVRTLTVRVNELGKPRTGVVLYFSAQGLKEPLVAKSDASGIVRFSGSLPAAGDVYTEREYKFQAEQGKWIRGRRVSWQSGLEADLAIELHDPYSAWLTIIVDAGKNLVSQSCSLIGLEPEIVRPLTYEARDDNRRQFEFGPVPLGGYVLSGGLQPPKQLDGGGHFHLPIQVDKSGNVTITVKPGLFTVIGKVTAPKSVSPETIEIHIFAHNADYVANWKRQCRKVRVDEKGNFEAKDVPDGRYVLTAVVNDGSENCLMVSQLVDVAKDLRNLKLLLSEDVGQIEVRLTRPPNASMPANTSAIHNTRFRIYDANGKELMLPVSNRTSNNANKLPTFYSIPVGVYRIRIEQTGALPAEIDGVAVKKGEKATVELALQAAHACAVLLKGIHEGDVRAVGLRVKLLKADGSAVTLDREYLAAALTWSGIGGGLTMWTVPSEVVAVQISIPGFRTAKAVLKKADTATLLWAEVDFSQE